MRLIDADLALGEIPNEIKDYAYWIKAQPTVFDVDFILTELNYAVAITALEEIKQYRAIGTVEECREAVEKQKTKQIKHRMCTDCKDDCTGCEDYYNRCPSCGEGLDRDSGELFKYCPKCGQVLSL